MVDCLIFSRDRPMQLDACLRSLAQNAPGMFDPRVLWKATDRSFGENYEHLWQPNMFMEENDFHKDIHLLLEDAGEYVLMLCDDAITYLPVVGDPLEAMSDDVLCMSLRMGLNTRHCHPRNQDHALPSSWDVHGPFIAWDWHGAPGDFGYPYSLDGTIHRRDSLLEWIGDAPFTNPNTMEMAVVNAIGNRTDVRPLIASYPHSCQVGLPVNRVNETNPNRAGTRYPAPVDELNERFLRGERVDLEAMDFGDVYGAHQEIELRFR